MELTGAQALIKSLEMQHVEVMFGLPGGAILPVYDPILDSSIRHILVRHEQGAGHMAQGYAQVTGRPGVAIVTSGPGATNVVTPLADAYMDSTPLVVITGQVATTSIGTDAFQESDITGITMGITKHNWLITDAADIPRIVSEAFHVAITAFFDASFPLRAGSRGSLISLTTVSRQGSGDSMTSVPSSSIRSATIEFSLMSSTLRT